MADFLRDLMYSNIDPVNKLLQHDKDIIDVKTDLTDIATVNNHTTTYEYNPDGSVNSTTEKDSNNNVIKTVSYTYNAEGDVTASVTVVNGKTVTTTYNYDDNGNIISTSNVVS